MAKKGFNPLIGLYIALPIVGAALGILALRGTGAVSQPEPEPGSCAEWIDRSQMDTALELGTKFILANQKPEGNFNYEYNWRTKTFTQGDNQVRQAGAMWGLGLIYLDTKSPEVQKGLEKALDFFYMYTAELPDGSRFIKYPGDAKGALGTVSLAALSLIEYLRADPTGLSVERIEQHKKALEGYLKFIVKSQMASGLFHQSYTLEGEPTGKPSPYFDGESTLALIKAAKYLSRADLKPVVLKAAAAGWELNVEKALKKNPDSDTTKGYYQWSSMAFYEIFTSGWAEGKPYGKRVIRLGDWMIDVHKVLSRGRNTGYAFEGITHAYETARLLDDKKHMKKYGCVIEKGLEKLTSWQVGHPMANSHIGGGGKDDPLALGGVQNEKKAAELRIDVAQHQMHAVILARKYYFTANAK